MLSYVDTVVLLVYQINVITSISQFYAAFWNLANDVLNVSRLMVKHKIIFLIFCEQFWK